MRRWTFVLVAIIGLMLVPLAEPAFCFPWDRDDGKVDLIQTDDGDGDDVGGCEECPDGTYACPPGCTLPDLDSIVVEIEDIEIPGPGIPGGITPVMDHIIEVLMPGRFDDEYLAQRLDNEESVHNTVLMATWDPVHQVEGHVDCLGMRENTAEIGGIKLRNLGELKVAKIFKFGAGGEQPSGVFGADDPGRVKITINSDTYTVPTAGMSATQVNDALWYAISADYWMIERNDYWIVGPHLTTGSRPWLLHVQAADTGLQTMHVQLRPVSFRLWLYDIDCGVPVFQAN